MFHSSIGFIFDKYLYLEFAEEAGYIGIKVLVMYTARDSTNLYKGYEPRSVLNSTCISVKHHKVSYEISAALLQVDSRAVTGLTA